AHCDEHGAPAVEPLLRAPPLASLRLRPRRSDAGVRPRHRDGARATSEVAGGVPFAHAMSGERETLGAGEVEVLAGRYEILGLLGAGGMGTVYRARDRELDEIVALKMLRRELVDAPGMLARFRQEAKLARKVTHLNVARTFDIGEHEGAKFLTMEYVEGE